MLFSFLVFLLFIFLFSRFIKKKIYHVFEPNVSVIIPTYNEERNIKACLDSLFASDYPKDKIEVIIVDDGSTDKTIDIIKGYDVKVLRQKHLGKVDALNKGVSFSSNDVVITLDADTCIESSCLREVVKPFQEIDVGATNGAIRIGNNNNLLTIFQNIEYHYNNLIRNSFSTVFKNGVWFFGALACYRRNVLREIGFFKKDTYTEDMDIAMEMRRKGYRIVHVCDALCYTTVPRSFTGLFKQRSRWWVGGLQSLFKNRDMFTFKYGVPFVFLFINQFFWSFYALISLPFIIYQINYWLPYNSADIFQLLMYLFRWFSLSGPLYVLYKLPEFGFSAFTFFGVASGIISAVMILAAIKMFNDRITFKNMTAIFFYFPYTIVLNMIIIITLFRYRFKFWKKGYFIY